MMYIQFSLSILFPRSTANTFLNGMVTEPRLIFSKKQMANTKTSSAKENLYDLNSPNLLQWFKEIGLIIWQQFLMTNFNNIF